jgi:hypothetical protein
MRRGVTDIPYSLYKAIRGDGLYAGEYHALLRLPNGRYKRARFAGPGTHLVKRIVDEDRPLSEVDKTSEAHDLRYFFATTAEQAREADIKMNAKIDEIERLGTDSMFNIAQAKLLKGKVVLEDLGLMKKGAFSQYDKPRDVSHDQKQLLNSKLHELEQQGYGLECGC